MNEEHTPTFSNAMKELETILERIEGEQVDVDELASQLRRAAELLDLCRQKIRRADTEVTQIVQRLDDDQVSSGNDDDSASGGGDAQEGNPGSGSEPDDDDIPF